MKLGVQLSAVAFAIAVFAGDVSADANTQDLKPALKVSEKINESAINSQKKIDQISESINAKVQRFKAINKETDGLNIYNKQLQKQIDNQLAELSQLDVSIDQVSVIERQITPLMLRMVDGLQQFVALDVPFLLAEREDRVANLQQLLERADVEVSEKFRRVLEAYQVEMDYGRTIEAYTGLLTVDGKERDVEFLRLGRVALIYQTRDGAESGRWDQSTKSWSKLSSEHRIQIAKGLRMARKQLAPDMLMLPINAAL
ncbi:DUF3450 domain-containing protein [Flocculibacter collagenilyticus]|uniref:DUF3450 domain-containing protein n=1 Tax=Flocculibacter collagenilyticus TaxID=2744479 RepID=UPI0018F45532|nr:DUF3450 domain-containing protein [Flocculibacter collagenilyticus]